MAKIEVRIPDAQKQQIEELIRKGQYATISDFIREAIRDKLKEFYQKT